MLQPRGSTTNFNTTCLYSSGFTLSSLDCTLYMAGQLVKFDKVASGFATFIYDLGIFIYSIQLIYNCVDVGAGDTVFDTSIQMDDGKIYQFA
jgi:hypothetical protein